MISTEALFTSRAGFGIETATPAQRAACRIMDGQPLGDLRDHPDVLQLVGGRDAIARLPSERGKQPTEVALVAAIRCGKSMLAAAVAIRASQTVDVSRLGAGETARVSVVSLKLDISDVVFAMIRDTIATSPVLRPLLMQPPTADSVMLRHPSGRGIEIACVAGAKAGAGLVGRWSAGVIFDEAPRMNGSDDGVVNLSHARSAILGRLLPGAQASYIGAAWAPHGPVYDMVQEFWQKPTDHMVVLRGAGPTLNPIHWTPERCAKLREMDEVAYATDVLGEFADPESGLLSVIAVRRSTRETPLELPPEPGGKYVAAVDPSEGAAKGNAWTLVIVQHVTEIDAEGNSRTRYRVALAREWRGLGPDACLQEIVAVCRRYDINEATSDQYAASALVDLAKRYGFDLNIDKTTASSKLEDFGSMATLVHVGAVELPPDRVLRSDLLSVKRRTTQAGMTIVLPKTSDGRHADFAPALASALKHAGVASTNYFDPVWERRANQYMARTNASLDPWGSAPLSDYDD